MPKFLEQKLKREYPNNPHAVYGTLNAIGAMKGNKITPKGAAMEAKHARAPHVDRGNRNVRNAGSHTGKLRHG